MLKIKYYQATVCEVFKKTMKSTFARLGQLRHFNNYELAMINLKGERFAGFKI